MKCSISNVLFLSSILLKHLTTASPTELARTVARAAEEPYLPFNFTLLFTAALNLGNASSPITIPGGVLINEPITSGIVTGPMINATVMGGFAHPPVYNNGMLQIAMIDIYGVTNDKQPFYIHETGVGSSTAQVTRIEININGTNYATLRDSFILASVNPTSDRKVVNVKGYLVENTIA